VFNSFELLERNAFHRLKPPPFGAKEQASSERLWARQEQ
jgi:hypothetical protein